MNCDQLRNDLPALLDTPPEGARASHVAACLRCQADLAQFRRVHRQMRALRTVSAPVPAHLLGSIQIAVAGEAQRDPRADHAHGRRVVLVAGGVAAAVSAGVGVAAVVARSRRAALALAN